jgi:outer membrane protein
VVVGLAGAVWCFLTASWGPLAGAQELKIGYVNIGKVFDGYDRTKASDAMLEKKGKAKEAELEGRVNELKKMRQGLELLNDASREAKGREIEARSDELQRFRKNTARDLRAERDRIAQDILKDIQRGIDDFAKKNGYAFIYDQRSLLYAQPANDVTDEVLQLLNSRGQPAAQKPQ